MDTAQASAVTTKTVTFRIWRQVEGKEGHFEEFRIPYNKGANVISCLMEIQRNPVTTDGKRAAGGGTRPASRRCAAAAR